MQLTFGPPRYFRPVCIRYPHGFLGGPAFYMEIPDPGGGPLIWVAGADVTAAWRRGEITLTEARNELDRRENHEGHGIK